MSAKVNNTLKRTVKPRRATAPIQYQYLSGKTLKFFITATPSFVTPSEA